MQYFCYKKKLLYYVWVFFSLLMNLVRYLLEAVLTAEISSAI